ncbi:MAG: nucleoside deaminase [Bacteroidia bacterium]|nr:nucleoside deaminase [Bacteroidia bacterium]
MNDEFFMKQAYKQALCAYEKNEVPIGAVVVANNKIISYGYNQTELLNDNTAHAEILALTSAFAAMGSKILDECTMYVTIEPCVMCAGALKWARIGKLVYGATEPKSGFTLYKPSILHTNTEVLEGVLKDECGQLMKNFFLNKRGF